MTDLKTHPASFRDPAGFVFEHEKKFYRQVNQCYADQYETFKQSGLYDQLVNEKKLLAHVELEKKLILSDGGYKTLLPEQLGFISYPYEWCFEQWKDAALLTLELVRKSMERGMILKDASPFNIQFIENKPVFIDTLSFEKYDETKPWIAYRQFTECFLAPLLLAKYHSPELLNIFSLYPQGIPLQLVAKLLPGKSIFNANVFLHINLPGRVAKNYAKSSKENIRFTKKKLSSIISNLESFVKSVHLTPALTTWNNYYEETVLSNVYVEEKIKIVGQWLKETPGNSVLDIGTNTGLFAEAAAAAGKFTIAIDGDVTCIDRLYIACRQKGIRNLIPLCVDITNPSPAIGWDNAERTSFLSRANADITMALAVIHHLAIGKNIGFEQIAATFSKLSRYLIIEFIPKSDPKVMLLLQEREDVFIHYNEAYFVEVFSQRFDVLSRLVIHGTERIIFLMKGILQQ